MNEFIKKLIQSFEKEKEQSYYKATSKGSRANGKAIALGENLTWQKAIEIVNRLAEEYKQFGNTEQLNNGWIPCSERLPDVSGEYLTWVRYDGREFCTTDEIDCDGVIKEWNCSGDYTVIAWQPLPESYQPKGETQSERICNQ